MTVDSREGTAPTTTYPTGSAEPDMIQRLYEAMVVGRRLDEEATALALQGVLRIYPSSRGQEACQVGAVNALSTSDWLFPTYRDSVAVWARGIAFDQVLSQPRGDWHVGYDPHENRVAPMCTPLATHAPHAVGLAMAHRYRGKESVALVLMGDGATSEGDFHAAANFAAVFRAPVVFVIQNNQWATSVPLSRQTAAASLADKAIGYGMAGVTVDGNDVMAVHETVGLAVEKARASGGPTLVEASTYRMGPHTTSDDPSRYRTQDEVDLWRRRDPILKCEEALVGDQRSVAALVRAAEASAEAAAADFRRRMQAAVRADHGDLVTQVYSERGIQ